MRNQILSFEERINLSLQLGESHFREFKSALQGEAGQKQPRPVKDICQDISKTLVAFANADGGELLVGVEDDGSVTGVPHGAKQIQQLQLAHKTHVHKNTPLQGCRSKAIETQGKTILYFQLPSGTEFCYLTSDGRCLQRKDLESVPVASENIKASRDEIKSKEYDRQFVHNATINDLDFALLTIVAEHISHGMSIEKCLQHLELAEYYEGSLKLKRAALLLFAKDVNKWHPRVQIRVIKVDGNELKTGENYKVSYDSEIRDSISKLIESGWDLLRPHLTETRFSKDALFKTQIIYPELACREALINAIAHRDYSNEGAGIEIIVYNDRIEIKNPGGLLSSISIDDIISLSGAHQSRNALVSRVLRELGYMRELGEGIRRIYELMNSNDLADPSIISKATSFSITLHQKLIYTTEEKLWLDNFSHLNLSRNQKTVVRLGCNGRIFSPQEIWEACGIIDTEEYRILVESMYNLCILESSIPSNQVTNEARRQKVDRKKLKRFSILLPQNSTTTTYVEIPPDYSRVYIGNIPYAITEDELITKFKEFGTVESASIPLDPAKRCHKGYAFIEFSKTAEAQAAVKQSTHLILRDRKLVIRWANPKDIMHNR